MTTARAGWAEVETTPPPGLPMGGRGPSLYAWRDDSRSAQRAGHSTGGSRGQADALDIRRPDWTLANYRRAPPVRPVRTHRVFQSKPSSSISRTPTAARWAALKVMPRHCQNHANSTRMTVDFAEDIVRVALNAVENLQPVTVTEYRGMSLVGINRRRKHPSGEIVMGPNPNGTHNSDLWGNRHFSHRERRPVCDFQLRLPSGHCLRIRVGRHLGRFSGCLPKCAQIRTRRKRALPVHPGPRRKRQAPRPRGSGPGQVPKINALRHRCRRNRTRCRHCPDASRRRHEAGARHRHGSGSIPRPARSEGNTPADHWRTLLGSDDELSRNLGGYWGERLESGMPPVKAVPWPVGLIRLAEGRRIAWIAGEVLAEWLDLVRGWLDDPNLIAWGLLPGRTRLSSYRRASARRRLRS